MKSNVLFNRSNSLQTSEAKHTNDTAAKFSFLDYEELRHSEEGIPSGGTTVQGDFQCTFFFHCITRKWEPGDKSLRGVAIADH